MKKTANLLSLTLAAVLCAGTALAEGITWNWETFPEYLDELEKLLSGLDAGKSKSAKLQFPENFREPKLAGQKAKAEVKLVSVAEGKLPG